MSEDTYPAVIAHHPGNYSAQIRTIHSAILAQCEHRHYKRSTALRVR